MAIKKPRITKAQQRILDKYSDISSSWKQPEYTPRYGAGSRGPTKWNQQISAISLLSEEYDLKKAEKKSALGLARRLNNVMKLVQKNEKVAALMEHRWKNSDLFEKFGYIDFKDLKQEDIAKLVEKYVAESGILQLPSLAAPKGTTANLWDS